MSRYNSNNGGSSNGDNDGDYEDDITLKLQEYAALRLTPTSATANVHDQYGTSFIINFEGTEILDGVVFQRENKPETWKVFSAGKFFNLNPEDGRVYEQFDEDEDEYSGEMSAQDILGHPRVAGFSENFGGEDYFYKPVGVVIEEAEDIATNDDLEVETTDEPTITVGNSSMLLGNKTWTRTFAKKVSSKGDSIIRDNDESPTPRGEPHANPKYDPHEWLSTEDPSLRSEVNGRTLEMWITEESNTFSDGETQNYTAPNVMDVKTGEFVSIDNAVEESDDSTEKAAATDGGTMTADSSDDSNTESTDSPDTTSEDSGLPDGVPDTLDTLLDYLARNADDEPVTTDDVKTMAGDEVDNPENVDWEAAADEANSR